MAAHTLARASARQVVRVLQPAIVSRSVTSLRPTVSWRGAEFASSITTRSGRNAKSKASPTGLDRAAVATLFSELVEGVEDMKEDNPNFTVSVQAESLTMTTPGGDMRVWVTQHNDKEVLAFAAPKTDGIHTYSWAPAHGMWASTEDGHFLKELLARELVYWCKGFPKF